MKQEKYVHLGNAREEEQRAQMEKIEEEGVCPFCPEHLARFHEPPILKETAHWVLTPNQWPYKNTRVHLLAIYRTHAERLSELPPEAGAELLELAKWAEKEFKLDAGAIGLRFGDPEKSGGTVRHIHAQILAGNIADRSDPAYQPVRFKVG